MPRTARTARTRNARPINRCAAAYAEQAAAAAAKLELLKVALRAQNCRANFEDRNWGYVGNLEHVNETLAELLSFLA